MPIAEFFVWSIALFCRQFQWFIEKSADCYNVIFRQLHRWLINALKYFVCSLIFVVTSIYWLVRYLLQCNELAVFFSEWEAYEMWFSLVWKWNKLIFLWTHDIRFSILTKVTWDFEYSSSRKKHRSMEPYGRRTPVHNFRTQKPQPTVLLPLIDFKKSTDLWWFIYVCEIYLREYTLLAARCTQHIVGIWSMWSVQHNLNVPECNHI